MLVLEALAVAMVLLASVTDLLEHKIYNLLTFPMMLIGILGHLAADRWWEGLAATVAVGAPFFLLYALKVLKAGDVKLFMALGALLGLKVGGYAAVCSVIAWAPIAIILLLVNRELGRVAQVMAKDFKPRMAPFGLAIGIGTLWALAVVH